MHFERIYQEYRNEGVEVAFVVSGASEYTRTEQLPRFKQDHKVSYPALDDKDNTVVGLYKLNSDPRVAKSVIIDRDGIVRLVGEFTPWLEMAETLETLLDRAKRLDLSTAEKAVNSLQDPKSYVRWQAAKSLGEMKEKAAVEPLIKELSDESEPVRELAAAALGKIGDARAVKPLLPLLQDKSSLVRGAVIEALAGMKDERAVLPLVRLLADREFRVKAADALAQINKPDLVSKALEENRVVLERTGMWEVTDVHSSLGRAYMQTGSIRPAVQQYVAAVKNSDARRVYVTSFSSSGIERFTQREYALSNFVTMYNSEGKLKEIPPILEEMLSEPLKETAVYEILGAIYGQQGLHEKAPELYEKAIILDPDNFRLYAQLAFSYKRAGMQERAVETAKRMATKVPSDADSYAVAAKVHSECDLNDDAIAFYEKAVSLASGDYEKGIHRLALAKCYEAAGKSDRAIAEYEETVKSPGVSWAKDMAQQALKQLKSKPAEPFQPGASKFTIPKENLEIPDVMQPCAENLRRIHDALSKYRKDKGDLPNWLSGLVPDYLSAETLLCPNDAKHVSQYWPDPKLPCSYGYELSPTVLSAAWSAAGMACREWKARQIKLFGDVVPIVRCLHHGDSVLNLSAGGQVYTSPAYWEPMFIPGYKLGDELRGQ